MAVNFLEMNEQPEKYEYFKRFIDEDKYKELAFKYKTGQIKDEEEVQKMKEIQNSMLE